MHNVRYRHRNCMARCYSQWLQYTSRSVAHSKRLRHVLLRTGDFEGLSTSVRDYAGCGSLSLVATLSYKLCIVVVVHDNVPLQLIDITSCYYGNGKAFQLCPLLHMPLTNCYQYN